jgi:hypothetical protein
MSKEGTICIQVNTLTSIFLLSLFQKEKVIKSQALYVRTRYQFCTTRVTHELTNARDVHRNTRVLHALRA